MILTNCRVENGVGKLELEAGSNREKQILDFDLSGIQAGIYIFEAFDARRVVHQRFI